MTSDTHGKAPGITSGALQRAPDRHAAREGRAMATKDALTRAAEQHYDEDRWRNAQTDSEGVPTVYITKTVAAITLGTGDMNPVEACYVAIARADEDGRFEFAMPMNADGSRGRYVITVEREFTAPTMEQY